MAGYVFAIGGDEDPVSMIRVCAEKGIYSTYLKGIAPMSFEGTLADYADKQELEESIIRRHYGTIVMDSEQPQGGGTSAGGMAQGIQAAPDSRKTVFRP